MNYDSNFLEGVENCICFKKLWNNNELELLLIKTLYDDRTFLFQFFDIALGSDDSANTISSCEGNCERLEPDVTSHTCDLFLVCEKSVCHSMQRVTYQQTIRANIMVFA